MLLLTALNSLKKVIHATERLKIDDMRTDDMNCLRLRNLDLSVKVSRLKGLNRIKSAWTLMRAYARFYIKVLPTEKVE